MNAHDTNAPFRALVSIARNQCANHRRDDLGWPLGNCIECQNYRKKMDAWHMAQVFDGNHDPDLINMNVERATDHDEEFL